MAGRGYQAMTAEQLEKLESFAGTDDKIEYWDSECYSDESYCDLDKAWDAIHRCLGAYPPGVEFFEDELVQANGTYPLKRAILGGRNLVTDGDYSWIIRLIEPHHIAELVEALEPIDEAWFSGKYWTHCRDAWPEYGEEDRQYTWAYFQEARDFLRRHVGTGHSILFMADQ